MVPNWIFLPVSRCLICVAILGTKNCCLIQYRSHLKYMALSDCSRQAVWIKSLLSKLGINVLPIHVAGDNQGSLFIGSNPVTEKRSKHIDTQYHYIQQCLEEKKISLYFVEGSKNPADMFTVHTTASGYVCHSYLMIFLHPTHYIHENSNLKNLVNKILTKFETLY